MFERQLEQVLATQQSEKTFIDKLLARQDVEAIRELIKKTRLKREDLLEILYLISGVESKLLNYGEWDRYVILKYFVWIREFVKLAELLYDYQDRLLLKQTICKCGKYRLTEEEKKSVGRPDLSICTCEHPEFIFKTTERTKVLIENTERLMEHNAKFLIDLYLNIGRTSLSLGATGLLEILKNKFEISYPYGQSQINTPMPEQKTNIFGIKK